MAPAKPKFTCSVEGCGSSEEASYHRYPVRDRDMYIKWLRATGRTNTEINSNSRVCQIHFRPEDFQLSGERRLLNRSAFPSVKLPYSLPEDADLGIIEPMSSVSFEEDSSHSATSSFISATTDDDSNQGFRRSVPSRRAKDRSLLNRGDFESSNYLAEFDPESSEREKRKLRKRNVKTAAASRVKPSIYDDKGILVHFQKDLCDCLDEECTGCHFPCSKCRSDKCGHECRQNRKWQYEVSEVEGYPEGRKNPYIVPKQ